MIKNIVFDMGGVLIDYNPEKSLHSMFPKDVADIALKEIFRNPLWTEKDRGTVSPDDIWAQKGALIPIEYAPKIKEMTYNLYPYMKPFPQMAGLIKALRKNGYGIFLLSNASADFYDNKHTIPAMSLFDGYLISADFLLVKPEKEIYQKLFTKFNLVPQECVFIDDVPVNTQCAIQAGMQAICYSHKDIEILKTDLAKIGVKI